MHARSNLVAVFTLSMLLGACSSLQPVADWQTLHEGDKVRVTTTPSDIRINMKVISVTPESIQGQMKGRQEPTVIAAAQIKTVEQQRVSALKTTGLVVGTTAGVIVIVGAIALASLMGGW